MIDADNNTCQGYANIASLAQHPIRKTISLHLHHLNYRLTSLNAYIPDERDIIRRISDGDESAFEVYVAHYGPQIERTIKQVVKSDLPVNDILQDVFINIWIAREKLPTLRNPHTWLFRIAYYRCFSWLRQQARQNNLYNAASTIESAAVQRSPVEEHSAFEETKRIINVAIEQLPPQTKKIYLLSREENRTINEIAGHLQLSPQTVKNTLSNALKNIRRHLENEGVMLPLVILSLPLH